MSMQLSPTAATTTAQQGPDERSRNKREIRSTHPGGMPRRTLRRVAVTVLLFLGLMLGATVAPANATTPNGLMEINAYCQTGHLGWAVYSYDYWGNAYRAYRVLVMGPDNSTWQYGPLQTVPPARFGGVVGVVSNLPVSSTAPGWYHFYIQTWVYSNNAWQWLGQEPGHGYTNYANSGVIGACYVG